VARWTQRHDPTHPNWGIVRELDAWSAQVDYLYTSAWALLAAPLLTQLIPESQANLSAPMLWLAGGLLIFAIAGDLRVIDAERTLLLKPVEPPKQ
jgi:hypothetical protein